MNREPSDIFYNFAVHYRKIAVKTEGCSPKDLNTLVARALQSSALRQSYSGREGASILNLFINL